MSSAISFLQNLLPASCRRRDTNLSAGDLVSLRSCSCSELTRSTSIAAESTDDTTSASASADTSGTEQVADSFDGSDTDNTEVMPNSEPTTGSSADGSDGETPGFADTRRKSQRRKLTLMQNAPNSCLNPNAPVFVPNSASAADTKCASQMGAPGLRESIRTVISALEGWERSSTTAEDPNGQAQSQLQSQALVVLQEAISTLTPQDAALVKVFVDSKLGAQAQQHQQHQWPAAAFLAPQRPLKPCTLSENLRILAAFDPACVVMVRKIKSLGINSRALLEVYFSKFGVVERVLTSHSQTKPSALGQQTLSRKRPAGLGFIVMKTVKDVDSILGYGPEHFVEGAAICVSAFESRCLDLTDQTCMDDAKGASELVTSRRRRVLEPSSWSPLRA